jgi:hypothetical protein
MEGVWPIVFLGVVLKIPIFGALFLIWYAVRAEPDVAEAPPEGGHGFRRFRPEPRKPRGPRRGPHHPDAQRLPDCPPAGRFRVVRRPAPARAERRAQEPARQT